MFRKPRGDVFQFVCFGEITCSFAFQRQAPATELHSSQFIAIMSGFPGVTPQKASYS